MGAVNGSNSEHVFAMSKRKPAAKFKQRAGAKAVKAFEREVGAPDRLGPRDTKTYRAISARPNYFAQDSFDGAYASKELRRELFPAELSVAHQV